jgi:plastocyanin
VKIPLTIAALLLVSLLFQPAAGGARTLDEDVEIVDDADMASWGYSPPSLTVTVGTTVTWRNAGSQAHGVTSQDQLFDSRLLDAGKSWSYTFDTPGTYRYFCVPHPWMKGRIVVSAVEEPTPSPTPSPSPSPTASPTPRPTSTPTPGPTSTPSLPIP